MKTRPVLWFLGVLLLVACRSGDRPPDWDARYVPALCTRAERLLAEGDREAARAVAEEALALSVSRGDAASEARARHVLGLVDGSPEELAAALRLLEELPDDTGEWRNRLVLAELSLASGALDTAEAHVLSVLDETPGWEDIGQRARAEALASHVLASVRRRQARPADARRHERWAALQLSVLPDAELRALRQAVAQALGDDHAALREYDEAFRHHAAAANLAALLEDERALLAAARSMGRDLVAVDRLTHAMDHAGRAVRIARDLEDWSSTEDIAREALSWLDLHGEPWDSARRRPFQQALAEASRRRAEAAPAASADDSTPRGG